MRVRELLRRIASVNEWNTGVADLRIEDLAGSEGQSAMARTCRPSVRWLHKPWFLRFQADPCLVEDQGRLFLYHEEVPLGSVCGRLRCTELAADGTPIGPSVPVIPMHCHAAYPYVFKHQGVFYCVPETNTSRRVALYRADAPLGPWSLHSILLEGFPAYDSTIFPFDGRWWLFCTAAGASGDSRVADLHVWYAAEPWGPWGPHRLRPVKTDIHSARPAGHPFVVDGVLYRPAQDCGPRYGARIAINRVLTLTPEAFEEEVCSYVEPDPLGPYSAGLHTLSSAGGVVIIDGCRKQPTLNPLKTTMEIVAKVRERI
ncbi:MAG: hypothetical protein LLG45_06725 [Actinomycetia bacterium]|nr:hypothetical protein [Actinomycetes bacterium]